MTRRLIVPPGEELVKRICDGCGTTDTRPLHRDAPAGWTEQWVREGTTHRRDDRCGDCAAEQQAPS